jgi:hypothetical protein
MRRLGSKAAEILTPRRIRDVMRFFDNWIKRQFNPFVAHCKSEYEVPIGEVPDVPEAELEDGYLILSKYSPRSSRSKYQGMIFKMCLSLFLCKSFFLSNVRFS